MAFWALRSLHSWEVYGWRKIYNAAHQCHCGTPFWSICRCRTYPAKRDQHRGVDAPSSNYAMFRSISHTCRNFENLICSSICLQNGDHGICNCGRLSDYCQSIQACFRYRLGRRTICIHICGSVIFSFHKPHPCIPANNRPNLFTALVYLLIQFRAPKLPNVAISLTLTSIFAYWLGSFGYEFRTLDSFKIGTDLFNLPDWELGLNYWEVILSTSFAVCLLCLLEGLSIGKSLSARAGARINANQETFSIGMGTLGCFLHRHACFRFFNPIYIKCR